MHETWYSDAWRRPPTSYILPRADYLLLQKVNGGRTVAVPVPAFFITTRKSLDEIISSRDQGPIFEVYARHGEFWNT